MAGGDSWEADDVFKVGDLTTLKPPHVRLRFTVNQFTHEADRTLAHIGVELLTHEAKVPFQMGQAGIRCSEDGTVAELEGDAAKKLRVRRPHRRHRRNARSRPAHPFDPRAKLHRGFEHDRRAGPVNRRTRRTDAGRQRGKARGFSRHDSRNLRRLRADIDLRRRRGAPRSDDSTATIALQLHDRSQYGFSR